MTDADPASGAGMETVMRICRFNSNRIGVVAGDVVHDVTALFDLKPAWPLPPGDWIVRQIPALLPQIAAQAKAGGSTLPLAAVRLDSPVANPGKIIGAPINYRAHIDEANADTAINHGKTFTSLDQYGLFIKANSALIGPAQEVQLSFPDRRNDHEVELAVIIGREGRFIPREQALDHVLGYSIGLDMTIRGPEFPGFRKSVDTFAVLGPWIVTRDEIADPNRLDLSIAVNGETRQKSNTSYLIFDVQRLIEYASRFYTLQPGDVIMTGTPEGVSQVNPGDRMEAWIDGIGSMQIAIAGDWRTA
ncbi:fumarylacetoacetate hydrolase family protein [Ferrovibrio sp.]|uniref:fumarylacetoacetate hydrolase family protein n=1 Tax=Ferrovibrio sp. TaxID=1917215 RepID=UPI003516FF15